MGALAVKVGKDSVTAFVEAEKAQGRLSDAFTRFPKLGDSNVKAMQRLNTALAQKTKFDDDATASGQAVLAQFGLTGKEIEKLTPLLQDYAAKTGKDLPTAAQDLGKAVMGQGRALKTIGLDLKDTGSAAGNLDQLMGGLRSQVGGFAAKEGKTGAGQAAILKNQLGELQEQIGAKLLPVLKEMATRALEAFGFVQRNSAVIGPMVAVVGGLAAGIWAVNAATRAWTATTAAASAVQKLMVGSINAETGARTGGLLVKLRDTAATVAHSVATKAAAAWTATVTAAQWAWNAAMTANPIGLIIAGVGLLVAGLVIAYKKSETFRKIVDGAFRAVKAAAETAFNWVKDNWKLLLGIITGPIAMAARTVAKHWGSIKTGATAVIDAVKEKFNNLVTFVTGLPARIGRAASGMWDGIKTAFRSVINFVIDGWNRLEFKLPSFDPPGPITKIGGFTLGVPDIPRLAEGGIVKARPGGTLAMLGEAGRSEAVIPLPRAGIGGGNVRALEEMARDIATLVRLAKRERVATLTVRGDQSTAKTVRNSTLVLGF